jgi:predicted alpha-1,6-mannanase (GH76 family)
MFSSRHENENPSDLEALGRAEDRFQARREMGRLSSLEYYDSMTPEEKAAMRARNAAKKAVIRARKVGETLQAAA